MAHMVCVGKTPDYCHQYLVRLFHAIFEDRSVDWCREEIRRFEEFRAGDDPREYEVDEIDQDFIYESALRTFMHDVDYLYMIDMSLLPDFYQLCRMSLQEVADLFPHAYTQMFREAME